MTVTTKEYTWHQQTLDPNFKVIDCPSYDPYKDYAADPSGFYCLVRVDFALYKIEAAICNKNHVILKSFRGSKAQDVYDGIFKYEKKHGLAWFKDKGHAAYLGKELKKAEIALALGQNSYFQE